MQKVNSKIMASFQMIGSRILSLNVKNDSLSASIINFGKKELDISHEIVSSEIQEDKYVGVIRLNVSVKIKQGNERYNLKLVVEGGFWASKESIEKEIFEQMLSLNGIASLYGIARAHICSISAQCFTDGSVILPMIDVTKYSKALNDKNGEV